MPGFVRSVIFLIFFLPFVSAIAQSNFIQLKISNIDIIGNRQTKESLILRELTFFEGDTLDSLSLKLEIEESKQNLLNLSLFNYVSININRNTLDSLSVSVSISVEERWYIWPYPILEHADRNFSNYLKDKDWDRVNYGGFLTIYNFRGRNETLKFKIRLGYKEQYAFGYSNPNLDRKKNHGISILYSKFRQKQIAYNTINNKLVYMKSNQGYLKEYSALMFEYIYRVEHNIYHNFTLNYYSSKINNDSIIQLNENYYGLGRNSLKYTSLGYEFIYDNRDLKYYPVNGVFAAFKLNKSGFSTNEAIDFWRLDVSCNIYTELRKRFFHAIKIKGSAITGVNDAYVTTNSLGYDDYLRGYEYYVIDGTRFFLLSNTLKWNLIPRKLQLFSFFPWKKFNKIHYSIYVGTFFDAAYVSDKSGITIENEMSDQLLYSYGLGLDFVTYYDKMLRLEYAINKFGKKGFYIHFQKYF